MLVLCGIVAALVPAVRAARKAAWRAQRANNLKQIALAPQNYNDVNRCLPPAVIRDSDGRPTSSWRLRIVPFLEGTNFGLDWRLPWTNAKSYVWEHMTFPFYTYARDSDCGARWETNVVALSGPGTAFDSDRTCTLSEIDRNAILLVEIKGSGIHWAEPRDLDVAEIRESITRGLDGDGMHVAFADGAVWFLRKDVPWEDLKKFFTLEGARQLDRERVLGPYAHW